MKDASRGADLARYRGYPCRSHHCWRCLLVPLAQTPIRGRGAARHSDSAAARGAWSGNDATCDARKGEVKPQGQSDGVSPLRHPVKVSLRAIYRFPSHVSRDLAPFRCFSAYGNL